MRGVLYQCQDVGFLNTGAGLGYNTYANPFVCKPAARQTVPQRYTGREFILPNMTFTDLPSYVNTSNWTSANRSTEASYAPDTAGSATAAARAQVEPVCAPIQHCRSDRLRSAPNWRYVRG
jgi:hypothetical protein